MKLDIQRFADGKIIIETEVDNSGLKKGVNEAKKSVSSAGTTIKGIIAGLGITKLISTAISTINSNIDGAVKRVDTLNNFPKVMSNLGIGANEASKSIEKMSDKLSGLPTTLDEGAMAVQRFTSKNNDIAKSTDLFLALNNAILAGGASTEIQSSALEQLSQAYAKGKPDMMEWRTAMTAMPAQLKQVAEAMGYINADELGEALRKGDESMDAFMETIIRLNKEGVNGFQNFEQQARNSTGGIGTSITVAKTQVVKGIADIITAINNGLADADLPGIGDIIASIGKKSKVLLDSLANQIPKAISILKTMYEALKKILPIVGSIGVAFASWKIGSVVQKAVQSIQKLRVDLSLMKLEMKSAGGMAKILKKAMSSLNTIMKANSITIIVAGITALVTAFIYLWKNCEGFRNFWINLWEGIKNVFSATWNAIGNFFTVIIPGWFQSVTDFFINTWEGIKTFFTETIPNTIKEFVQNVIEFFKQLPYNIGYLIGTIIGHFINWKQRLTEFVTIDIPNFIKGVIEWFKQLPGKIAEFINSALNKIKEWGNNLIKFAQTKIPEFINKIVEFFKQLPGKIWAWLVNTITKFNEWLLNMRIKAVEGIKNVTNAIIDGFKQLPAKMAEIGANIVRGIWAGIQNSAKWFKDRVKEFADGIVDGIKATLKIKSPSRVMRDEVGKYISQGIGVGMINELDDVYKDMQNAIDFETSKMTANVQSSGTYQMAMAGTPTFNLLDSTTNKTQLVVNGKVLAEAVNTENRNREVARA